MRLFLGVRPDERILKELVSAQQALRTSLGKKAESVKFASPQFLHLTLHFLGEVSFLKVGELTQSLKSLPPTPIIHQPITRWVFFPKAEQAAVLALTGDGDRALSKLYEDISERLKTLGIKVESRTYVPHFTLARTRHPIDFASIEVPAFSPMLFEFQRFQLYQSHLTAEGSQYEALREIDLADPLTS